MLFLSGVALSALAVALSSTSASAFGSLTTLTTNAITATPTGGLGPYTFNWSVISDDGIVATTPNASTTSFRKATTYAGYTYTGTATCTVTDSVNNVIISGTVYISITHKENTRFPGDGGLL